MRINGGFPSSRFLVIPPIHAFKGLPMKERLQLNIRMDNEPELYAAIKEKAYEMNTSVSSFVVASLKASLAWQMPFDAPKILERLNEMEKQVARSRGHEQRLKELEQQLQDLNGQIETLKQTDSTS